MMTALCNRFSRGSSLNDPALGNASAFARVQGVAQLRTVVASVLRSFARLSPENVTQLGLFFTWPLGMRGKLREFTYVLDRETESPHAANKTGPFMLRPHSSGSVPGRPAWCGQKTNFVVGSSRSWIVASHQFPDRRAHHA